MQKINVSFPFYFNEFCLGGEVTLPKAEFDKFIRMAEAYLLGIGVIFDKGFEYEIKLCLCDAAEKLYTFSKSENVKQESIDGYSVTFLEKGSKSKALRDMVLMRLGRYGLLYAGVEESD